MWELIAWISAALLACCAIPQAWKCYKTKSARDLSWSFLLMWLAGEIGLFTYSLHMSLLALLMNYFLNIVCLIVMLFYKLREKGGTNA